MNLPPVILASASPRRAQLLSDVGIQFRVIPGHAEEIQPGHLTPHEIAEVNAYRKASTVAKKHPDSLVIGADTIVALGQTIFGKPRDGSEARTILEQLQGKTHHVITGVCLIELRARQQKLFAVSTAVRFRTLSRKQIDEYLRVVNTLDKAGAYAIQEHGEKIVEEVNGSFTNVVGLPLERLREELREWQMA